MKATLITATLLALVMLIAAGCTKTNDDETLRPWPNRAVGSVEIFLPSDTLTLGEADTTSADGWVLVSDAEGRVLPNAPVNLSLEEQYVGAFAWPNPPHGTTDDQGRVGFRYHSFDRTGSNAVLAESDHHTARFPFVVIPWQVSWTLSMVAVPNPTHSMITSEDSILIAATLVDSAHAPVPNVQISLQCTGGRFTAPFPRTNSLGRAQGFWQPWFEIGTFLIVGRVGTAYDSVTVFAIPPIDTVVLSMTTDTLAYMSGDSAYADGTILVKDRSHEPMAGVRVDFSLRDPIGTLQLLDPALIDTTNAQGMVAFRFTVYHGSGHQTIHTQAANMPADWEMVVMEQPVAGSLTLSLSPDTIRNGSWVHDSTRVSAMLVDEFHNGIPGIILNFHAVGSLSDFPPTNSSGITVGDWWPGGLGRLRIIAGSGSIRDTAYVVVIDTTQ